jgi:threo-3-hydroxy-L-aspartate ammonia-lyase
VALRTSSRDLGMTHTPGIEDVRRAAERIRGVANETPVFTSRTLDERAGASVFLKCENFQRSGAFKFRGALNAVRALPPSEIGRGLLTFSSGNHAGALALVGRILDVPVTVVMPEDAPRAKLAATREYGAEVILYDPQSETREEIGARLRDDRGLALIPPYDHFEVVAGQGTAALEMFAALEGLDAVIAPCGGGGLLSGTAIVAKALGGGCRVVGAEPAMADDATRSFRDRSLHTVRNPPTIADGLRTPSLGRVTFPIVLEKVDEFRTVSESEIVAALRFLWERAKLVVEPSAAVAVAPLLSGRVPDSWGSRIGVILSGGNVDVSALGTYFSGR